MDTLLLLAHVYESTGRAVAIPMGSVSVKVFVLVKVFKRLYLLGFLIEVIHTCPNVRYWSEVLCSTIRTNMNDLEVKISD